jgi:hypothetical protein
MDGVLAEVRTRHHTNEVKVKVNLTLEQSTKAKRGNTLSLTSALNEGGCSAPRPVRFILVKETRNPFYRELSGPQGRSGRVRKISPLLGFDPRIFQPVASRYTDCAIPAYRHHTNTGRKDYF